MYVFIEPNLIVVFSVAGVDMSVVDRDVMTIMVLECHKAFYVPLYKRISPGKPNMTRGVGEGQGVVYVFVFVLYLDRR